MSDPRPLPRQTHDLGQLERFLAAWFDPTAGCAEIRIPESRFDNGLLTFGEQYTKVHAGWFDNPHDLIQSAKRIRYVSAYITVNPINVRLMDRSRNRITKAKYASNADDVAFLRWMLLDIDAGKGLKPKGVSSTEEELAVVLARRDLILAETDWVGSCLWGCSGNGGWILPRLPDYPNDDRHRKLVADAFASLQARYSDGRIEFDATTKDPSRIMALVGTLKCKGEHSESAPWRTVTIDSPDAASRPLGPPIDLEGWLAANPVPAKVFPTGRAAPVGGPSRNGAAPAAPADRAFILLRARKTIFENADSISGSEGHNKLYGAAVSLIDGFGLTRDEARAILADWNRDKARPPESDTQVDHKLDDAIKNFPNPRLGLLNAERPGGHRTYAGQGVGANGAHERNGTDRGDAEAVDPGHAERPEIAITTQEHIVIGQAVECLAAEPTVFQRGNLLVTVLRDVMASRIIQRPAGLPRIAMLPLPRLRELLTKNAKWVVYQPDGEGGQRIEKAHPPVWAVAGVNARGEWPDIAPIEGIVETPIIRPDGSILESPGYDARTAILFDSETTYPMVPVDPSCDEIRQAVADVLDIVVDFPFKAECHKAAWLAALLTPLCRFAFPGPSPLFLFDANSPGTGKSKLTDLIAVITTGRDMARTSYPDTDEEMRKRITSIALAGDRLMLLDNIATTFGGSALDSALTGTTWRDRILGKSELTAELPLFTVWLATGNNVSLRGDILRRIIPCRLETAEEKPEERTEFTHPNLVDWVRSERADFVVKALIIVRGYCQAGRPRVCDVPLGGFEGWSELVRSSVLWATGLDPCAGRQEIRDEDPEISANMAVIHGWAELDGGDRMPGLTTAEALRQLRFFGEKFSTLRDALMEWSRNDDLPGPRVVGVRLKQMKGRVFNGRYIRSKPYEGTQYWWVEQVSESGESNDRPEGGTLDGTEGTKGSVPRPAFN